MMIYPRFYSVPGAVHSQHCKMTGFRKMIMAVLLLLLFRIYEKEKEKVCFVFLCSF